MKFCRYILLCAIFLIATATTAVAKDSQPEEEVDFVALGARMLQDGHHARAQKVLEQVDESDPNLDRKLYFVLKGLLALHEKLYTTASESFQSAIVAGNTDPLVYINLAQAQFGRKQYEEVIQTLNKAGSAARKEPRAEGLLSQAYWEMGQANEALTVLKRAIGRFPDSLNFPRLKMQFLLELGLYQELADTQAAFLQHPNSKAQDFAAICEAMRKGGRLQEAKRSLESARLRFPDNILLTVQLARVFMDAGQPLSSALLLEDAARHDDKYLVEAAEMYRRSGRLVRALVLNKRIGDQRKKMRQRLQILLELERFEMIAGMESRLARLGLLADQQIRYALAYGFFQTQDFDGAERHLQHLSDPDFFEKGLAIRKAIQTCKQASEGCLW